MGKLLNLITRALVMGILQNLAKLKRFKRNQTFVRLERRFDEGHVSGYVLEIGPKFFLLAVVNDQLRWDGFSCYRIADIKTIMRDPYGAFAEAALRKSKQRTPKRPAVNVADTVQLLWDASKAFPLVTIHREGIRPDVCWIGRVTEIRRGQLSLLEIGPDAKWYRKPALYRLRDITAIQFGGGYENALYLVGGVPHRR